MAFITTSHARDGVWSCEGVMSPHRCMKAVFCGYTTLIITSHLVFLTARQSSQKNKTQCPGIYKQKCPGITQKCPGITQLPSLVMCACERPLKIFRVPHGTTLTSLVMCTLALVSVTQCPGLIYRKVMTCVNKQLALLFPLKGKGIVNIEKRGAREREKKEERHLIMMRAGPVSAKETHPVPASQHK